MGNSDSKIDFIVGKMIDGARALNTFFNTLSTTREAQPREVARELTSAHGLTLNQQRYLNHIVERTERAKGIVQYLEGRFGVDSQGRFQDAKGLQSFLDKTRKGFPNPEAQSHNIAIGLSGDKWSYPKNGGFVKVPQMSINGNTVYDQLSLPLDETLKRAEAGKPIQIGMMVFYQPNVKLIEKRLKQKKWVHPSQQDKEALALGNLFGWNYPQLAKEIYESTKTHELRHVFDAISEFGPRRYLETQAYLSVSSPNHRYFRGLERDYLAEKEFLEKGKKIFEGQIADTGNPEVIREINRGFLSKREEELRNLRPEAVAVAEILRGIDKKEYHTISYIFSTNHPANVPHYLELARDYLAKKK